MDQANTMSVGTLKLEGTKNWNVWKFQVKVTLKGLGLYDVIDGSEVKPEEAGEEYGKWLKRDSKAQSIIVSRLSENVMIHILACDTAEQMWKKLLSVFEQKSTLSIHLIQERFFSLKYEGEGIAVHIAKVQELDNQLKQLGQELNSQMLITKVLTSLPEEYKHFVSAWESVPEDKQTFDDLIARLLIEEERMTQRGSADGASAFVAGVKGGIKCFGCGKLGHYKRECTVKPKIVCHYCKKPGHMKKDCRYRQKKVKNQDSSKEEKSNAFMVSALCGKIQTDQWVVDSGASEHMCRLKECFSNYMELTEERMVVVGNGAKIRAIGIGQVTVEAFDGKNYLKTTLNNVLHVPQITANLFSVSTALDKGYTMISDGEECRFVKNNEVKAVAVRKGKMYIMKFRRSLEIANVGLMVSGLKAWHGKMVHQDIEQVKNILKRSEIVYELGEELTCEPCVQGKQHKQPFLLSKVRTQKPGQLIHMDVCGPMEETSLGGSRYYLLIKDDFSRYRTVYFLKNKSEVAGCIRKFVQQVKVNPGHRIKTIRSDNGKEFINQEVKKITEENGIIHQTSVDYTLEQNGCAEREIRTITEAARTLLLSKNMKKELWAEAIHTAVYVLNRTGKSRVQNKTPDEVWYNRDLYDVNKLKIFGSKVGVHVPDQKRRKWDAKAEIGYFVGYGENTKGYRIYFPDTNQVSIKREVIFIIEDEKENIMEEKPNENETEEGNADINEEEEEQAEENIVTIEEQGRQIEESKQTSEESEEDEIEENERPKRDKKKPGWLEDYNTSFIAIENEPNT